MTLKITVEGMERGEPIPDRHAFCVSDKQDGENISPAIYWSGAPSGTRSFALFMIDRDSPVDRDNANKVGRSIPAKAPRQDFYHWLLIDIPADTAGMEAGGDAGGIIGQNSFGARSKGANGYDGPCPPWNDELWHRYYFIIHAFDVPSLRLEAGFNFADVEKAMKGHILAKAEAMSVYTTNQILWAAAAI